MKSVNKSFKCNICNKNYKSKNSLGNHNRKYHSQNQSNISRDKPKYQPKLDIDKPKYQPILDLNSKYKCSFCNKEYKHIQSRWKHEQKCKVNYNDEKEILKKENMELKKEIKEMKKQLIELMNKSCKIHPKTLQKINNQLNNCNITNINIVQFGKEDVINTLSRKEKLKILNNGYQSFNKLIEYVHFNDNYPQFKNIAITNLKDNIAYKYNPEDNKFIACKKDELLEDLMDIRTIDLEEILNENIDTINNVKVSKLKSSIEKLYDKDNFYDRKKSDIKLMIYNKSDKNKSDKSDKSIEL